MKRTILLLMSLALLLTSSSFFLPQYIVQNLSTGKISLFELTLGEKREIKSAIKQLYSQQESGSSEWLRLAKKLAPNDGTVAHELANYFKQQNNQKEFLFWLEKAAEQSDIHAKYMFVEELLTKNKYNQAIPLLTPLLSKDKAFYLRIKIALALGDISFIKQQLSLLNKTQLLPERFSFLAGLIKKYQILPENSYFDKKVHNIADGKLPSMVQNISSINTCENSIQFFATSLDDIHYTEKLIEQFAQHKLANEFCFHPVRYIPITELSCRHKQNEAIRCDESIWQAKAVSISARYIAVLLPQGGANVHLGILYLDNKDTSQVLAHEASHLLGYVDEYPLPKNHLKCAAVQTVSFAPNVAVLQRYYQGDKKTLRKMLLTQIPWASEIAQSTPIFTQTLKGWKLGTPKTFISSVGIYPSSTCDKTEVTSFKPLARDTQLTYFELDFPKLYIDILKNSIYDYRMPSFHYNIALALFNKHQIEEAKVWLNRSAKFETNPARKARVISGDF